MMQNRLQSRSPKSIYPEKRQSQKGLWFERLMAIVATVNLGLVAFNFSYIPWRDTYLKILPDLTVWYGEQFKGIEPHRFTVKYLEQVNALENQVAATGLDSPDVARQLAVLTDMSHEMINDNPFASADKAGTLERIKHHMRQHVGIESSTQAFNTFWSQAYLAQAGWQPSMQFFNRDIRPLIASNYYRNIGFNGEPINRFWTIDIWFMGLFGLEFVARTLYLSRRYHISWLDAIVWRWYDIPLLLPFWRWLRVIPVTIRLNQAQLVNLEPLHQRIVRNLIAQVAVEMTEMVVVRLIDQLQDIVQQGDLIRWVLNDASRRYIDINGVNEVDAIAQRLIQVTVYQVMPQLKPDIETLLSHTMTSVLSQSPLYTNLQQLPGVKEWSHQLTKQLAAEVCQNGYHAITASLEDEVGTALVKQLVERTGNVLKAEIQQNDVLEEIQSLSVALLDEIKINYVKRVDAEDVEKLRASKQYLYQVTQGIDRNEL